MGFFETDLRVQGQQRGGERAQLREYFDASKPAAHDDEGEQAFPLGSGRQGSCPVEVGQYAVANSDGLFDGLETDGLVGDARNRERTRDRTGSDHDDVVRKLVRLADRRRDRGSLVGVVHVGHLGRDDIGLLEMTAVCHDRVTRIDRPGSDLGQKGLVGHIRQRVNNGDVGFA